MIVLKKKNYSYLRSTWKDARGEERGRAHFERALAAGGFWSVLSDLLEIILECALSSYIIKHGHFQ